MKATFFSAASKFNSSIIRKTRELKVCSHSEYILGVEHIFDTRKCIFDELLINKICWHHRKSGRRYGLNYM